MKKKIDKVIDKSLRFHHRDIHGELTELKKDMKLRAQVKSKFYYIFCCLLYTSDAADE